MPTFRKTTTSYGLKGYRVRGLDPKVFRGLRVVVARRSSGWFAYEASTGISLTPPSWAGGLSNKTRAGILQILAYCLPNIPESAWEQLQEKLNYKLQERHNDRNSTYQ